MIDPRQNVTNFYVKSALLPIYLPENRPLLFRISLFYQKVCFFIKIDVFNILLKSVKSGLPGKGKRPLLKHEKQHFWHFLLL